MEYRNFEQKLAHTLRNEESNLDINALIESIHGKQKKNRRWLLIWFFAITSLSIAGAILYFNHVQDKDIAIFDSKSNPSVMVESQTIVLSDNPSIQNLATLPSLKSSTIETRLNKHASSKNFAKKIYSKNAHQTLEKQIKNAKGLSLLNTSERPNDLLPKVDVMESGRIANSIILPLVNETNILSYIRPLILTDKVECPTFSNKHNWYLELIPEIGYFIPIKTLQNTTGEQNNVFESRKQKEKTLEGLQAALYIQVRKQKSPFYFRTGLSYARLTEKMQLDYSYTKLDTTRGIISVTVSQTGDTVTTIIGDIITQRKLSGKKLAHHAFSLYDIPVAIGYEKKMGRWSLGLEGGVMLNISMNSEGSTLVSDTSFLAVDLPTNQFRSNVGLSYFGGLNIARDFNKLGRFYVAARARFIPTSFTTDQNRWKQSYHFAGLHLGYVYTF